MLDARYHLFYSILVVLMLGIGIIIGASYYGSVQVRQQSAVLHRLEDETNAVVQDRNEIKSRLTDDETALESLRPALVHGKLSGKRVVLIQTGDYADATQSANQALGDAGATVAATVVLTRRWGTSTPQQRAALSPIAGPSDPAAQDKALLSALASALVRGTGTPTELATVTALQQEGLITLSGDLSLPCTLFVLVGGNSSDSSDSSLDTNLLAGFQPRLNSQGSPAVTVVGCEPYSAAASSIPAYQSAGAATVDCIDLPLGQIALPFALRGEVGDYGIKPTAKQRLPASLGEVPAL